MALQPGRRLGPYEIQSALGAGGMGEVYRARDTRLDRTVAIKVLPADLASDPALRERFDREARTISSFTHPHICALYDVGSQDGVDFLVMEYLDGETLVDRLRSATRLAIDLALQVGIDIADALDKAHRQGVVHRDLKPGNIMLTRTGAKLLDFGLAKRAQPVMPTAMNSALVTNAAPITTEGAIIGTLQYMAPEQLEGREADTRTDIFAFGSVLYEMVTGRRAFEGKSQVSVMAAIVDLDPPLVSSLVPVAPAVLDHLVKTCVAKNPEERWQSMADVLLQLRMIASAGKAAADSASRPPASARLPWAIVALTTVLLLAAVAIAVMSTRQTTAVPQQIQFDLETPLSTSDNQIALSPDGSHIVAQTSDGGRLWLRSLAQPPGTQIAGTERASWPFFSPSGSSLAFFAEGKLKRVDIQGGPVRTVADSPRGAGGDWNGDDVILYAPDVTGPLYRVSATGGTAVPATRLDPARDETAHRHPSFLPDGRRFLYLAVSNDRAKSGIMLGSLDSQLTTFVIATEFRAEFSPPDRLLFLRDSTLTAQRFVTDRGVLEGDPMPIADDVGSFRTNSAAGFSASNTGALVYRGALPVRRALKWFDRKGTSSPVIATEAEYSQPALSPDGRKVVVSVRDTSRNLDLWMLDLDRSTSTRFTFDPADDIFPRWLPDGRVVYGSNRVAGRTDLFVKAASGLLPEQPLLSLERSQRADDVTRDGRFLLFTYSQNGFDLWTLPLTGEAKPQSLVSTAFNDTSGQFSPDGKWIAYQSDESGRDDIYLIPFPNPTTRIPISPEGGNRVRWRRDGKELFYISSAGRTQSIMAVAIDLSVADTPRIGEPEKLFEANPISSWDVAPDGQRFLLVVDSDPVAAATTLPLRVIVNWIDGR